MSAKVLNEFFGCSVLLTLGSKGAIYLAKDNKQNVLQVSAPSVEVVDTTGAGDSFIGAFVFGLATSQELSSALRMGVAAGSLACTQFGAQNGLDCTDVTELADSLTEIGRAHV